MAWSDFHLVWKLGGIIALLQRLSDCGLGVLRHNRISIHLDTKMVARLSGNQCGSSVVLDIGHDGLNAGQCTVQLSVVLLI